MKKTLILLMILALLPTLILGCAKPAPQPDQPAQPEPTIVQQPTTDGTTTTDTTTSGANAKIASQAKDAQGTLNGWIDGNSVEIEITPEDVLAFRVTDVKDQMKGINDGDKVKFSYESNNDGQMIITKIEKMQ